MKVVVMTCDKHSWIIPIFRHFYDKYWSDNPYQTEIITETDPVDGTVFYTGGISWSSGLLAYLRQSDEDRFLIILEDHLITSPIDTRKIKEAERLCRGDIGYVRLRNNPHRYFTQHTVYSDIKDYREYPTRKRFSMTIQAAIWQKRFLFDALRESESAWETELQGALRLRDIKNKWRLLWPKENIIKYSARGLMRKGILQPPVLRWALSEFSPDTKSYKILREQIEIQRTE